MLHAKRRIRLLTFQGQRTHRFLLVAADAASWRRLGSVVRERREALRLTQQQAATNADIAVSTWRLVEDGKAARSLTLSAMSQALSWPANTLSKLLDGSIVPVDEVEGTAALTDKLSRLTPGQREAIEHLVDEMLGPE